MFCIRARIIDDYSKGDLDSLIIRLLFVSILSIGIAFLLKMPLPFGSGGLYRKLATVLVFLSILFYPIVTQISFLKDSFRTVKHEISSKHGNKLDKAVALVNRFPAEYEAYAGEKFTLPKWFVYLDAIFKVYALGVTPNNSVAVGKDGFFFEGWGARKVEKGIVENFDNIADYMGQIPFSENELKQWRRALEERAYWLRERGVEYVFVLAPTKALVYPEFLPSSMQRAQSGDMTTRYRQLTRYLSDHADIHFIDLLPALLDAKSQRDYPLLFYKTDFHWNFYGAFIAYRTVIDRLRELFPHYGLITPEFSEFELSIDEHWAHHRFMNMIGLPSAIQKNEHYITMIPKRGGRWDSALDIPEEGIHDVYPPERTIKAPDGRSLKIRMILNPDAKIPTLLLLGDSFLEKCVYFFSGDARRVMNWRTIVNFPAKIFEFEKPDIVVQEILNMFILREPPKNPAGFSDSYLKGKFRESTSRLIINKTPNRFVESMGRYEIRLADIGSQAKSGTSILRIVVNVTGGKRILIQFHDREGNVIRSASPDVDVGKNEIYQEINGPIPNRIVIFESDKSPEQRISVEEIEIRRIE